MASVQRRVLATFFCAAAMAAANCGGDRAGAAQPAERAGPAEVNHSGVPVVTAQVVEKAMPVTVQTVGAVEAISTVQIHAQVTAQLSEVHFNEGQDVQKGQLLFTLDPRPFEVSLRQAEAVLAKDSAQATSAETTRARNEDLFNRGLIARNDYDVQVANAVALRATVEADAAAVDAARLNLQYTRITAPASGRTGALLVHVGDLIRANDTNAMVVINQVAPINVTASVPGNLLDDIQRHRAANPLQLEAVTTESPDSPVTGKLTFVDNAVDSTTGAIKIKGAFANTDGRLWPGLFVNVTLRLSVEPHAVVAPSTAVQQSQQGPYVYVVGQDSAVEMRPVTIARTEGTESVVATGLRPGERVVTDGQLGLTPGAQITERPALGAAAGAR